MDSKWADVFEDVLQDFHVTEPWTIRPMGRQLTGSYSEFTKEGKVKFECHNCQHKWTSMKGVVVFKYRKHGAGGEVSVRAFGQRCTRCASQVFEAADWYEDEVKRVLSALCTRICEKYYNLKRERNLPKRDGNMKESHKTKDCEACLDGQCPLSGRFGKLSIK